jgi:hypothetical protein
LTVFFKLKFSALKKQQLCGNSQTQVLCGKKNLCENSQTQVLCRKKKYLCGNSKTQVLCGKKNISARTPKLKFFAVKKTISLRELQNSSSLR